MRLVLCVCLLDFLCFFLSRYAWAESEFNLQGEYIVGGLFPIHYASKPSSESAPVAIECLALPFYLPGYQMFQVMRFAVEEINNSSNLLPNVFLGYEIFDHCSDTQNFPSILDFFSQNGSINAKWSFNDHLPKVISLTGPFGSTETMTVAPLFMMDLIPMVTYGSSSYTLSNKWEHPSFRRTVASNKDLIQSIIRIIQWFGWNWVAFIGSKDEYSENGLKLFQTYLGGICLAYQETLDKKSQHNVTLQNINMLNINVIIVFATQQYATEFIKSAIRNNIQNKVWIASDAWSMNQQLPKEPGIETIGTIIGITERVLTLPGFSQFVYRSRMKSHCMNCESKPFQSEKQTCNQACETCTSVDAEDIVAEDPTYSFPIYSAVYTMAHALHNALQCDTNGCNKSRIIYPFMLHGEMKKLDFILQHRHIKFDKNGDPPASYGVMLWHLEHHSNAQMIGTYDTYPTINFMINNSLVHWHGDGTIPFSNCSVECNEGFVRKKDGIHTCCFWCEICSSNTYAADAYTCLPCLKSEWSEKGSTSCQNRTVEYLHFTAPISIAAMLSAVLLIALLFAITVLFAYNYSTPVVRSAGGSMCFLMLGSLGVSTLSVFFFFGKPHAVSCVLRTLLYTFFYTVCMACLAVRSFQIVCIFKMAAKFPKVHNWWVKNNGQWCFIAAASFIQLVCFVNGIAASKPHSDATSFKDLIILSCYGVDMITMIFPVFLSFICFIFSYMGTDLPKNYNEAKSITFSLLLFYLGWTLYFTVRMMSNATYIQLIKAGAQLFSLYSIVFSYFIAKSYIIIFQPVKNTQEYFQSSIQTYTQTISRM